MATIVMWVGIGVLALFLLIGMIAGLIRGLKRSSLHILFLIGSVVLAFFITKPITELILNCKITIDGSQLTISEFIIKQIQTNFDISSFDTATEFLLKLPNAIVSPILFIALTFVAFGVFDIIYLIVARLAFGSKKKDFEKSKPYRAYGALVGIVEGFMFLFVLFAPLSSLTKTYQELAQLPPSSETTMLVNAGEGGEGTDGGTQEKTKMKTIAEKLNEILPKEVNEAIFAYNDCVVGKIAGAGGLDNALFDYLSNFKLEGEKIEFRKEIISMADVYDDTVVIYNYTVDKNYSIIDLGSFKKSISVFMDKGIFKTVVSNTVKDFVLKFDEVKEKLGLTALPQLVEDVVKELQTKFSEENFDIYEYLKNDVLQLVDTLAEVFRSDIITKFNAVEKKSLTNILNVVGENNDSIKTIVKDFFKLNLVKDSFNSFGKFASEKLSGILNNEKGLEIALNTNIVDKEKMVDDVLAAVDKFLDLDKVLNISSLLESTDIIATLTKIDDLGGALDKAGDAFDTLRNLEIFVLPVTETRPQTTYVFDNILSLYNLEILNDEVYLTPEAPTKTKLDTYTKFFSYIKQPIVTAKDLGLTDIGKEGTNFDTVLDKILFGLNTRESLLSDILLPFYQLKAMDLKTLVFDNVVNQLGSAENTNGLLSFDKVKTEANADTTKGGVGVWNREFVLIGKTLNALNKGSVTVGTSNKTYLKALLDTSSNYDDIFKAMVNASTNDFESALAPIFTAVSFEGLTKDIFNNVDTSIGNITGIKPTTSLENLSSTKENTISTIKTLLKITLNSENLTLQEMGQILDALKVNAYNTGTKDGVLNEVFANIIWYMTGDDITGTGKFSSGTPNENAKDVKAYLEVSASDNFVGYYTYESYEDAMKKLDETIDFATSLNNKLSGITLADDTIADYVAGFKSALDELTGKTEEEKVEIINNMKKLIDNNADRANILSDSDKTTYGNRIVGVIDSTESGLSASVGTALKNLLGLGA